MTHRRCVSGERLSGLSSCISILSSRVACFCVEPDEEFAGQSNADDHFLFAGLEQSVSELSEAFVVSGSDGRDQEEDRTNAGAAAAGGSLALPLATVIGDRGETDKLGDGFVRQGADLRQLGVEARDGPAGNALHL